MEARMVKVGIVGCGNISDIYFEAGAKFDILDIVACADLVPERARAKAEKHDVPRVCSTEELLADPEVEIVINLTIPQAHAEVGLAAVEAGKSVYSEKPLTIRREDGALLLQIAKDKGVRVGCAPDTFLGGGLQTCRQIIDEGRIGRPIAATAFMMNHGHEHWHPAPEFYYRVGGGPMFDMGPYYLTALVSLLGPVRRVTGSTQTSFPQRTITSEPKHGQTVRVEVDTHVAGLLDFACGAVGTIITSFDVWAHELPFIEIYGTEGTLRLPDPNTFGGMVRLHRGREQGWEEISLAHAYTENSRGLGVADMAYALRSGRPHRANGEMAHHVLDIMHAIHEASEKGRHITLESSCQRPAPMVLGLPPYMLDE
jgi:predicted dehydrogenase